MWVHFLPFFLHVLISGHLVESPHCVVLLTILFHGLQPRSRANIQLCDFLRTLGNPNWVDRLYSDVSETKFHTIGPILVSKHESPSYDNIIPPPPLWIRSKANTERRRFVCDDFVLILNYVSLTFV